MLPVKFSSTKHRNFIPQDENVKVYAGTMDDRLQLMTKAHIAFAQESKKILPIFYLCSVTVDILGGQLRHQILF